MKKNFWLISPEYLLPAGVLFFVAISTNGLSRDIYFDDSGPDIIKVGNTSYYELGFRKVNGSFAYILDKSTNQESCKGSRYENLWGTYTPPGNPGYIGSSLYSATGDNLFTYSWDTESGELQLIYTPGDTDTEISIGRPEEWTADSLIAVYVKDTNGKTTPVSSIQNNGNTSFNLSGKLNGVNVDYYLVTYNSFLSVSQTNRETTVLKLFENYPNPFTAVTTIKYKIPEPAFVSITVYNALGKEVATLVDEYKPSGNYKVKFIAQGLNSGISYYKLQAGKVSSSKKMILLKYCPIKNTDYQLNTYIT